MRGGHIWLAALAVYPIVGAPLAAHTGFRRFGLPARIVFSAGVGAVLLSWTMTLWALLSWRWGPLTVLTAIVAAFALRAALRGEGAVPAPPADSRRAVGPGPPSAPAIAVAAMAVLTAFLATAAGRSTSPDLLLFWGAKAQQFAAVRTIDAAFLSAPNLEYLHIYYPPLVTNVFAVGAMPAGRLPWGAVTLTFPILLAATAIGLAGSLREGATLRDGGPVRAWSTSALAVSALSLLGVHASVAGNAEPFLWFFEVVGLAILLSPMARSKAGQLGAGLLFAGAAASKVEGLPFVLVAVGLIVLLDREVRRAPGGTLLRLLGPTAVSLGTWFGYGAARKLFYGYHSYGRFLDIRWDHVDEVVSGLGRAFWRSGYGLPFLVPLLVLVAIPGRSRKALVPIGVGAALAAFFAFTYLHGDGDPRLWIGWSAARVFSPLTALLALAAHLRGDAAAGATTRDIPRPSRR